MRACRSNATTFEQNDRIFYIRWKNLDYRVASLSFVSFRHLSVLLMGRLISHINTRFFISNTFISNARLKLAKNQTKAKQNLEAELLLFENYLKNNIQKISTSV